MMRRPSFHMHIEHLTGLPAKLRELFQPWFRARRRAGLPESCPSRSGPRLTGTRLIVSRIRGPWAFAKSLTKSCVLGAWLAPSSRIGQTAAYSVRLCCSHPVPHCRGDGAHQNSPACSSGKVATLGQQLVISSERGHGANVRPEPAMSNCRIHGPSLDIAANPLHFYRM